MNYRQEMEKLREAIAHVDALRDLNRTYESLEWGLDEDALEEAKYALLARFGALVIESERKVAL